MDPIAAAWAADPARVLRIAAETFNKERPKMLDETTCTHLETKDFTRGGVSGSRCETCIGWHTADGKGWRFGPLPPRAAPAPKPKEPEVGTGDVPMVRLIVTGSVGDARMKVHVDFPVSPTAADVKQLAALVEAVSK